MNSTLHTSIRYMLLALTPSEVSANTPSGIHSICCSCSSVNSGTEATMDAIHLARGATGREKLVKVEGGYHEVASCLNRLAQMERLLSSGRPLTPERLRALLRDHTGHPNSVCRHPDPSHPKGHAYETVASVIMVPACKTQL